MSIEFFKTRGRANTASRIYLVDPATGKPTDHWVEVVSSLSDSFRAARERGLQEAGELASEPDQAKRRAGLDLSKRRMHASLLCAWSFDAPCTPDAALEFLLEAPQVADMVVVIADDRQRFFASSSDASKPGPEPE